MMIAITAMGFSFIVQADETGPLVGGIKMGPAKYTLAQEDFFDDEEGVGDADEEIEEVEVEEPVVVDEDEAPKAARSRFRNRRSRFNRSRNRGGGSGGSTKSVINNRPTTPVKDLKVKKAETKPKKKKMTFAEAQPEDITDENFPDIIESFDYPNANIMDVANAISKLTKKNFIMEPGINGKITIVAPTKNRFLGLRWRGLVVFLFRGFFGDFL